MQSALGDLTLGLTVSESQCKAQVYGARVQHINLCVAALPFTAHSATDPLGLCVWTSKLHELHVCMSIRSSAGTLRWAGIRGVDTNLTPCTLRTKCAKSVPFGVRQHDTAQYSQKDTFVHLYP